MASQELDDHGLEVVAVALLAEAVALVVGDDAPDRTARGPDGDYRFVVRQDDRAELVLVVAAVVGGGHMVGGGTQSFWTRAADGTWRFIPFDWSRTAQVWFCNTNGRLDHGWVPITPDLPLTACGDWPPGRVLGDHELFDVYLDYNLVAAALAGVPAAFPPNPVTWTTQSVPQITSTLAAAWPNALTPAGENLKALTELRSGGDRPLFDLAWTAWANFLFQFGALDGTVPRSPGVVVDNTDAVYQFDGDPALSPAEQALNDAVLRVAQTPAGRVEHGVANVPVVNGTPPVPVLTLYDLDDLFVPFSMEQVYARRVAAAGLSDRVVQRAIRGVGHCDFNATELVTAFTDLVRWVEAGVKPAGDDVLTPSVVAAPTYGCQFTTAIRPFTAPCP